MLHETAKELCKSPKKSWIDKHEQPLLHASSCVCDIADLQIAVDLTITQVI